MRRVLAALAALPLVTVLTPPAAAVDVPDMVVFTVALRYVPFQVTVAEGDTLDLVNLEPSRHDIVALNRVGGEPVFSSEEIGAGERARVVGVESLLPSLYPFICAVHDSMTGTLTVQ